MDLQASVHPNGFSADSLAPLLVARSLSQGLTRFGYGEGLGVSGGRNQRSVLPHEFWVLLGKGSTEAKINQGECNPYLKLFHLVSTRRAECLPCYTALMWLPNSLVLPKEGIKMCIGTEVFKCCLKKLAVSCKMIF